MFASKVPSSKMIWKTRQSSAIFALIAAMVATCCWCCLGADAEPNSAQTDPDPTNMAADQYTNSQPKRQYLIAPRVGRSSPNASPSIWSALEEASFLQNGQIQPQRGFPTPLKSSLLFLVGNRRLIGPRSTGLLPQARIGRRAAPMGLMPQPRVGRRSYADATRSMQDNDGDSDNNGQQEVALSSLSDSSLIDAIESMIEVVSSAGSSSDRPSADATIERPAHRATAFVPRLGKRERPTAGRLEHLLCPAGSQSCLKDLRQTLASDASFYPSPVAANNNALASTLARLTLLAMSNKNNRDLISEQDTAFYLTDDPISDQIRLVAQQQQQQQQLQPVALYQSSPLAVDLGTLQQMCREARESSGDISMPIECGHFDSKRVAFTPRIG